MKNMEGAVIGNTGVKITACRVEDYTPGFEGMSVNYPFKIVFEVETTQPVHYLIRLRVYEVSGVLIFVCSTLKNAVQLDEPGKYRVVFEMPAHIFNETMYSFDFDLINPNTRTMLYKENKFLTIKMSSDQPVDEIEKRDYLPGVTKPLYRAETVKLS